MRIIVPFILILLLSACGGPTIATVNDQKIPLKDYTTKLRITASVIDPVWAKQPERAKLLKEQVLGGMIDEYLLLQEAKRLGITASDEELSEEYARFKSQYTEDTFQEMLKAQNVSYDDWKEQRRRNFIIEKLRNTITPEANKITDAEIKSFYDQNIKEFQRPEEVRARQILVQKKDTADMIHSKIEEGENFAALAQEYSISPDAKKGGDLGFFSKGTFPAVFDRVCFALPVGGVSDVTKSEFGYQIFKVTDRRKARTIPFSEAKKMIQQSLQQAGGQKEFEALITQLRLKAKVNVDAKKLASIEVPYESNEADTDSH